MDLDTLKGWILGHVNYISTEKYNLRDFTNQPTAQVQTQPYHIPTFPNLISLMWKTGRLED